MRVVLKLAVSELRETRGLGGTGSTLFQIENVHGNRIGSNYFTCTLMRTSQYSPTCDNNVLRSRTGHPTPDTPQITLSRRLNEMERSMYIQSGSIFVWEESDDELGLKRWTDGKMWSQSRMREPYLFYDEKVANESTDNPGNQSPSTQAVFRFVDGKSRASSASSILTHFDRSAHRPSGLVKQAYSALVMVSPGSQPRKWHLTAYFTYDDLQHLPSIDNDPTLRSIIVPEGVYRSEFLSINFGAGS
ncbi:Gti1 Pac2 family containing [Pyrrhoderma noxium]|uniref:Gti1 Pac2 family containing n=1 Tax=Pyrrhoderma noxium TaxID=2282107 RepID=A0A286UV93_9AGAM|nr:Gti1 Pac2 family containing [Pyrrhoderma noxium]